MSVLSGTDQQVSQEICEVLQRVPSVLNATYRVLQEADETIHYGVNLNVLELLEADQEVGTAVISNGSEGLRVLELGLQLLQAFVMDQEAERGEQLLFKPFCHPRLLSLPKCPELTKPNVSAIRSADVGRIMAITGTIIRTGMVKMLEFSKEYQCDRCAFRFTVCSELEQQSILELPQACPNTGGARQCKSTLFTYIEGSHVCRDYQEIKIQEQVQKLSVGSIPRSVSVVLQDDLADRCQAGDDVVLVGVLRRMWQPLQRDQRCDLDLFLEANSISITNQPKENVVNQESLAEKFCTFWRRHAECPLKGRDTILRSICTQLYGLFLMKMAVMLTAIGGVPEYHKGGAVRVRGESHLLIVGDPGTGKSQLLKYAAKLSTRSVLTTGIGTTSSGLTVSAVKEASSGEWVLEAGALVLADGGICCIDEFGCMNEHDRACIHEAMEQQTLSVAKAGLVCTLNTRTTVFAVLNPKGTYDREEDIVVNCAIASPLLSRFDIILLMLDTQNTKWDTKVTQHIMESLEKPPREVTAVLKSEGLIKEDQQLSAPAIQEMGLRNKFGDEEDDGPFFEDEIGSDDEETMASVPLSMRSSQQSRGKKWSLEDMRSYVMFVKKIKPRLTYYSRRILTRYYQQQRSSDQRNAARTTIRLLESLIRLAQAHARLMFRDVVLPQDAVFAVTMIDSSITTSDSLSNGSSMQMKFEKDPDVLYEQQHNDLLRRLAIPPIPAREMVYDYANLTPDRFETTSSEHNALKGGPADTQNSDLQQQRLPAPEVPVTPNERQRSQQAAGDHKNTRGNEHHVSPKRRRLDNDNDNSTYNNSRQSTEHRVGLQNPGPGEPNLNQKQYHSPQPSVSSQIHTSQVPSSQAHLLEDDIDNLDYNLDF